jgi:hypothetical protein
VGYAPIAEEVIETDNGLRFILGGAWSSPTYLFNRLRMPSLLLTAVRRTDSARCVIGNGRRSRCWRQILVGFRDYSREKPVGDEAFRVIRGFAFSYGCAS